MSSLRQATSNLTASGSARRQSVNRINLGALPDKLNNVIEPERRRRAIDVVLRSGPFGGYVVKPSPKAMRKGGRS